MGWHLALGHDLHSIRVVAQAAGQALPALVRFAGHFQEPFHFLLLLPREMKVEPAAKFRMWPWGGRQEGQMGWTVWLRGSESL